MSFNQHLLSLLGCVLAVLMSSTTAVSNLLPNNFTLPIGGPNVCFAGEFKLALEVKYLTADAGKFNTSTVPLDNATYNLYSGSCTEQNGTHLFQVFMNKGSLTIIELWFSIDAKNVTSLTHANLTVSINNLDGFYYNYDKSVEGTHYFQKNLRMFETDQGNSYRCNSKSTTDFGSDDASKKVSVSLIFENVRIQPFVDASKPFTGYAIEKVCTADMIKNPSNLIPIIVGVCLAVLVIIVLVAYLIGRRRNRHGYQSV